MCPKLSHFSKSWLIPLRTENTSFISLLVWEKLAVFCKENYLPSGVLWGCAWKVEIAWMQRCQHTSQTQNPSSTPHVTPTTTEKKSAAGFGPCVASKPPQKCHHIFLYQQEHPPLYKNTLPTGIHWRGERAAHPQSPPVLDCEKQQEDTAALASVLQLWWHCFMHIKCHHRKTVPFPHGNAWSWEVTLLPNSPQGL